MKKHTDILIVTWNTRELCKALLLSIQSNIDKNSPIDVIVVDNGSTDDSAEMIRNDFPWVKLISSDTNLGYARGNNLGIPLAKGEYILLLNSDTEVRDSDSLGKLINFMENNSSCAAVGPALMLQDGALQTGAAGFDINLTTAFNYFFFLSFFFPKVFKGFYINQVYWSKNKEALKVDWISGASMLVRRQLLEEVGGVPTDYFMYAEDIRLCRLFRTKGYDIFYMPDAVVMHHHGGASSQKIINTQWIGSTLREYGQNASELGKLLMKIIFCSGFFMRYCIYNCASLLKDGKKMKAKGLVMKTFLKAALREDITGAKDNV